MTDNIILKTDSYKPTHDPMYLDNVEKIYSYFETREGEHFPNTVFFGLQGILIDHLEGVRVTPESIDEAGAFINVHIGPGIFNREGWEHILNEFDGKIPIEIWASPEGSVKSSGDILMVTQNVGGKKTAFITSYLETLLVQTWYPTTVASLSRSVKDMFSRYLVETTGSTDGIDFMLHDFGCRGATGMEAAAIGGLGHLVNFSGTDTIPALVRGVTHYDADRASLGFSVAAAEHSIMTSLGRDGESEMVGRLLEKYPTGILAAPIDSYDYMNYVTNIAGVDHKDTILNRDGKFVFRPDSTSSTHPTPEEEMVWLAENLYDIFGGTQNELGYKILDPHIGMLWGDGITPDGIDKILWQLQRHGFAASNAVFGMGGGLLQKVNRDTQRFAYKCSAQLRDGTWHDIKKEPLDTSKTSKAGRFDPIEHGLELVFDTGKIMKRYNFEEVRQNAEL